MAAITWNKSLNKVAYVESPSRYNEPKAPKWKLDYIVRGKQLEEVIKCLYLRS